MTEGREEVNRSEGLLGRVTIPQAATLLGIHPNTVRKRVKAGVYDAEKVLTENGATWMIDRDSLVNTAVPRASQPPPSHVVNPNTTTPTEFVQDLLRPFVEDLGRVREELGAERVLREQAEQERDELRRRVEALEEDRPLPEPRDAPEKASEEVSEWVDAPTPLSEGPEGSAERRGSSWWRRLFGFDDRGSF